MMAPPARDMAAQAGSGKLALQRCALCGRMQYPPREVCSTCLADQLEWHVSEAEDGEVLASTVLHHSHEPAFRNALPLCIGLVQFDCGVTAVCFLADGCIPRTRVRITVRADPEGRTVLTASPAL